MQAASLRALESWPGEGSPLNPAGWLYRVARHHAIDQLRRDGRHDELPTDEQRAAALSRWHLMAGIAAEHAAAPTYEQTNWATIVG